MTRSRSNLFLGCSMYFPQTTRTSDPVLKKREKKTPQQMYSVTVLLETILYLLLKTIITNVAIKSGIFI